MTKPPIHPDLKDRTQAVKRDIKTQILKIVSEEEEARLTKNRLKVMYRVLKDHYPTLFRDISPHGMEAFLHTVEYTSRKVREATEDYDQETKKRLSQKYQINLGYSPGHDRDVKILRQLTR